MNSEKIEKIELTDEKLCIWRSTANDILELVEDESAKQKITFRIQKKWKLYFYVS